jgi:hypothetical protein
MQFSQILSPIKSSPPLLEPSWAKEFKLGVINNFIRGVIMSLRLSFHVPLPGNFIDPYLPEGAHEWKATLIRASLIALSIISLIAYDVTKNPLFLLIGGLTAAAVIKPLLHVNIPLDFAHYLCPRT